ncbi:hypothetical protein HPB50_010914 [Hyalomma asiaticum]|uniref:Uncharacterized protein n=1 Tax=Hyalomma asiaticum TaxID=266040 RepID=A0ACB7RQH2_HYAAI|nr:hypothetical protein HPB50_010914 [Hyalomma asiaticum]
MGVRRCNGAASCNDHCGIGNTARQKHPWLLGNTSRDDEEDLRRIPKANLPKQIHNHLLRRSLVECTGIAELGQAIKNVLIQLREIRPRLRGRLIFQQVPPVDCFGCPIAFGLVPIVNRL